MKDSELRAIVLAKLYELRHTKNLVNPMRELESIDVGGQVVANICEQLSQQNLIEWRPLRTGFGIIDAQARITSFGVDVVEGAAEAPIALSIDSSVHVYGSTNVQVGSGNIQGLNLDIEKLNAAIDGATATLEEKAEAKSLLRRMIESPLLRGALEKWINSHLGR